MDSDVRDSLQTELDAMRGVQASIDKKLSRGHLPPDVQEAWALALANLDYAVQAVDCHNQCGKVAIQFDGLDGQRCDGCAERYESRVA